MSDEINIPAGEYDANADINLVVTVTYSTPGDPPAGYTFQFVIEDLDTHENVVTVEDGGIAVSSITTTTYVATVSVTATDNAVLTPGVTYRGALWRVDSGHQDRLWSGDIPVVDAPQPTVVA